MTPAPAPTELVFSLRLSGFTVAGQWHAELEEKDGRRHKFATPLELFHYLAQLASPPSQDGGLR